MERVVQVKKNTDLKITVTYIDNLIKHTHSHTYLLCKLINML